MDQSLTASRAECEGLPCVLVGPLDSEKPVGKIVVLLHGFGASGTDLVPCAPELISCDPEALRDVLFVFPEAPRDLTMEGIPGGRAWWPINMAALMEMFEVQNFDELAAVVPEPLSDESDRISQMLDTLAEEHGVNKKDVFVGGFSQGAMLATDVALRTAELGGLVVWSGTMIAQERWSGFERDGGISIVQSHGKMDPVLPFSVAETLRDFLVEKGNHVDFHAFDGFHQTDRIGITKSASLIAGRG